MVWQMSKELTRSICRYSEFPATGISLRQMVQFGSNPSAGTLFRASQFTIEELPIRLAHRVRELERLPNGLSDMPSIQKVKNWYAQSFEELTSIPQPIISSELKQKLYGLVPDTDSTVDSGLFYSTTTKNPSLEDWHYKASDKQKSKSINSRRFFAHDEQDCIWPSEIYEYNNLVTQTLQIIKSRHDATVATVAQGVKEWKQLSEKNLMDSSIQSFLDRFYMSRIGIRMMIGQHIAINTEPVREDYVGIICTKTNIAEVAHDAVENARFICEDYYDLYEAPKVEIICKPDLNFMYVPGHLTHMLFEVVKNSLRAVVETHSADCDNFPPIKIIIAEGDEDITIKVSDEGGGIARSASSQIWNYMYTTVQAAPSLDPTFNKSDFKAPMAGFGYGLPISKLYAKYFGGDLKLISMEGYGTDVYLHLNRLSSSSEALQ
ncbi:pyruvate dehydrogenase kinase [Nadsonia fulvescens var. elongata DSM 6958]|uniref:Protein-serine/threonine kinase n=1 Tax=Nadsonia fulvescens var. elongata DSM 6958 TaxID=857566 RepID=A0A1E3PSG6_9ASCO|nr:pyruvate dehydrogenase kinase [Nadsonia fulvescens var. elongata DSM 6958]